MPRNRRKLGRNSSPGRVGAGLAHHVTLYRIAECATSLLLCLAPAFLAAQQAPATPAPIVQPGAPGAPSRRLPASTTGVVPALSAADVAFMQGMIMHHSQAVEMTALIPGHTENAAIRTLGARISRSQSDEMKFMQRWLAARGQPESMAMPGMPEMDRSGRPMALMPGMLSPAQMDALRNAHGSGVRPPVSFRYDPTSHRSADDGTADLLRRPARARTPTSSTSPPMPTTRSGPRSRSCRIC